MSDPSQPPDYEARSAYQDIEQATQYDQRRFSSLRGKLGDLLDKRAISRALSFIPRDENASLKILDIPCGTGRITTFLLERGAVVTGADISNEMMQIAGKKVTGYRNFAGFFQTDASSLIFENDTFDVVMSIRFIGHIPPLVRQEILKEFSRVSPYVIMEFSLHSRTAGWLRRLDRFLKTGSRLPRRWGWHTFEKETLEAESREAGLTVFKIVPKIPLFSDSHFVLFKRAARTH